MPRKSLISCLLLILLLLSGCPRQSEQNASPQPSQTPTEVPVMKLMQISSKAFAHSKPIPAKYTCQGTNVSPQLSWGKLPDGTRSQVLMVEDLDAPSGNFIHWVVYNLPPEISGLPEDLPPNETLSLGALQGLNDFKKIGYSGPCPPPGALHRYYFRLYALDAMLALEPGASRAQIDTAMNGHLLGRGELFGTFSR